MQLKPVQLPKPKLKDTKDAVKRTQSECFASTMVINLQYQRGTVSKEQLDLQYSHWWRRRRDGEEAERCSWKEYKANIEVEGFV